MPFRASAGSPTATERRLLCSGLRLRASLLSTLSLQTFCFAPLGAQAMILNSPGGARRTAQQGGAGRGTLRGADGSAERRCSVARPPEQQWERPPRPGEASGTGRSPRARGRIRRPGGRGEWEMRQVGPHGERERGQTDAGWARREASERKPEAAADLCDRAGTAIAAAAPAPSELPIAGSSWPHLLPAPANATAHGCRPGAEAPRSRREFPTALRYH